MHCVLHFSYTPGGEQTLWCIVRYASSNWRAPLTRNKLEGPWRNFEMTRFYMYFVRLRAGLLRMRVVCVTPDARARVWRSACRQKSKMRRALQLLTLSLALVLQRAPLASSEYDLEQPYPPPFNDSRVPLYFSLIQSFSGQYISSYSLPGLQLALDLINDDPEVLPGYSLHFVLIDTLVSM